MLTAKPLKELWLTQPFGANAAPFYKQLGMKGHNGADFSAKHGDEVYAVFDGQVISRDQEDAQSLTKGRFVYLQDLNNEHFVVYFHLLDNCVQLGQMVKAGDLIGHADNTGQYTTGDHLHFAIYPVVGRDRANGYDGAIDPEPFFPEGWILNPTSKTIYGLLLSWEGRLIKGETTPEVYLVKNGKICLLKDEIVFWTNGYTFTQVDTTDDDFIAKAPRGAEVPLGKKIEPQILKEMVSLFKNEPGRAQELFTKYF